MKLPIINKGCVDYATQTLNDYYKNDFIVSEKKTYLSDLKNSTGPYLGIENEDGKTFYMLDCASQIASLGLGFNPTSFFGVSHFLESHTNNPHGEDFKQLLLAYENFLKRKLNTKSLSIEFKGSGAESIETALGKAFEKRTFKTQKKVLAFEGSFHGRLLVSLASTWNKSKRVPFVFPGFETSFLPAPFIENSDFSREVPENWISYFENSSSKSCSFEDAKTKFMTHDQKQLEREIESLIQVKEQLEKQEVFALVIEPMQCEGGDRYFSSRFMNALLSIAKTYNIPFIFDEVQTGFHLGRDFFWHRSFDLKDSSDRGLFPDYVVCAKKSQSGLVISFDKATHTQQLDEINCASVIRGYYQALILDQSRQRIINLEKMAKDKVDLLIKKFSDHIHCPRCFGMAFAFDIIDPTLVSKFIAKRFDHGLLFYPAGEKTLRFRLNTSFKQTEMDFLFERLESLCLDIFSNQSAVHPLYFSASNQRISQLYHFQEKLLNYKLQNLLGKKIFLEQTLIDINEYFKKFSQGEIKIIDRYNFKSLKPKIQFIQQRVYEPSRQTSLENFERCIDSKNGLAIGLFINNDLTGISFCSSLRDHPFERGVRRDQQLSNPQSVYMLDTTIAPNFKGLGLGRDIKYALSLLLIAKGYRSISGRNRDQMAASMLSINSSLGAIETEYIREDYPDFEDNRDVIYYTSKLNWQAGPLQLSSKNSSPLSNFIPNEEYIKKSLPILNNKICLSNFVSSHFLKNLKTITEKVPNELKHLYTTSGQSECVDKIIKSLWYKRKKDRDQFKLLSFEGHYFGKGSFLSRDLSGLHSQNYFPTIYLPNPTKDNFKVVLKEVESLLKDGSLFSIWIEPLLQKSMREVPKDFLQGLIKLSHLYKTPVVYNETASSNYRYHKKEHYCSNIEELRPSAIMQYLGGQAGICLLEKEFYITAPLMVISTWDGDELSFFQYLYALKEIKKVDYPAFIEDFTSKLTTLLNHFPITDLEISNGRGSFKGVIPIWLQAYFKTYNQYYIIDPSFFSINSFVGQYDKILEKI